MPDNKTHFHSKPLALIAVIAIVVGMAVSTTAASAASPTGVVINEIMYSPASDLDGDEFLELANTNPTAVDVSGWTFTGITATLPAGSTIPANGFFVLSPDAARFQTTYGRTANAVYTGKLSNGGELLAVKDASSAIVDQVTYADAGDWPASTDGLGPSLELIDPTLDHNDPMNWAASTATKGNTAGTANSTAHTGLGPRISAVTANPPKPAANQSVTVTATVTAATANPTLRYKTDFGAELSMPMNSTGGDAYAATLPGVAAGHLLRYRVQAVNGNGTSWFPRVGDTITYQGVVAASGVTSAVPVLEWFIADADYNEMVNNPTADIIKPAAIAYGGTVYDNVSVNIRGAVSQTNPKVSWDFNLPHNHPLDMPGVLIDPVDTFAMKADWTDPSHGRELLSYRAYSEAGISNNEVFPLRTQRNAKFQGLYLYVDKYDGTWRDREGYSNDQFFKAGDAAWDPTKSDTFRFSKETPKDGDYTPVKTFTAGVIQSGNAQRDFMLANADIPEIINYAAVTAITQNVDIANHNFYLSQDTTRGRWSIIPWDMDKTFGNTCCDVDSPFVTPAEPGDKTNALMRAVLSQPEWRAMYFRRLKTLTGQLLAPNHFENMYDTNLGPAKPEADLDMGQWPTQPWMAYAPARTALFNAITARRSAFANDSRVPGAQSANPNIVINEIQHSPTGGGNAEFLELYNPSATEAVDVSGWSIADGINLQIEPGTVILPHGQMVFTPSDPTFRTTYGGTVFVGGTYSGGLSGGETLTLKRADGTTDDQVTYGGAGWPQATGGPSLELVDPASDNNVGTNWALSTQPGGSPGAANQAGSPVNVAPSAVFSSVVSGSSVAFDGSGSVDPDGSIASYAWTFGDGGTSTLASPSHVYPAAGGDFPVTLTVTDNGGASNAVTHTVSVPPVQGGSVAFVAAAHSAPGATAGKSVIVPAAAKAGDTMVLVATTGTTTVATDPSGSGWRKVDTFTNSSMISTVWTRKVATGDAGSTIGVSYTGFHKGVLSLSVYSGVDPTRISAAHAGDSNTATHTSPTLTATAGDWALTAFTDTSSATTAWTTPAGLTRRDTAADTGTGRYGLLTADRRPRAGRHVRRQDRHLERHQHPHHQLDHRPPTGRVGRRMWRRRRCSRRWCRGPRSPSTGRRRWIRTGSIASYAWSFGDGGTSSADVAIACVPGSRWRLPGHVDGHRQRWCDQCSDAHGVRATRAGRLGGIRRCRALGTRSHRRQVRHRARHGQGRRHHGPGQLYRDDHHSHRSQRQRLAQGRHLHQLIDDLHRLDQKSRHRRPGQHHRSQLHRLPQRRAQPVRVFRCRPHPHHRRTRRRFQHGHPHQPDVDRCRRRLGADRLHRHLLSHHRLDHPGRADPPRHRRRHRHRPLRTPQR